MAVLHVVYPSKTWTATPIHARSYALSLSGVHAQNRVVEEFRPGPSQLPRQTVQTTRRNVCATLLFARPNPQLCHPPKHQLLRLRRHPLPTHPLMHQPQSQRNFRSIVSLGAGLSGALAPSLAEKEWQFALEALCLKPSLVVPNVATLRVRRIATCTTVLLPVRKNSRRGRLVRKHVTVGHRANH